LGKIWKLALGARAKGVIILSRPNRGCHHKPPVGAVL